MTPVTIVVSLSPVLAFLVLLVILDTFKLLRPRLILLAIAAGCGVALVAFGLNRWLLGLGLMEVSTYDRSVGPILEEALKAMLLVFLIRTRRIGFMVDAAILGFAVGAGFALVENLYYLGSLEGASGGVWVVRGFGTAVMHGGTTSIFAILAITLVEKKSSGAAHAFIPGLAAAIGIHVFFNQFLLSPVINTALQLAGLPLLMAATFARSEQVLRDWLEVGLDTDVSLLDYITSGTVSDTRAGKYLLSLKGRFPGCVVGDMLCMLRIHLELAIRAKGILMMREAGFKPPPDPEIKECFKELSYLEQSIGKTGRMAIAPILHNTSRDLWQIYMLQRS
jgi:RsiW-degrading membrane proteinase PrsW (M82 family)